MEPTTSPEGDSPGGGGKLAVVSLGSNIRPEVHLARALAALRRRLEVQAASSVYASPAKGAPGTPPFLNAAVSILTDLRPLELKYDVLRPLEAEMGRERSSDPNAPREIDLDLSLYGDLVVDAPERGLQLPDPDLLTCAHVALPAAEVAGDWLHPVLAIPLAELARRFSDDPEIRIVSRRPRARQGGRLDGGPTD